MDFMGLQRAIFTALLLLAAAIVTIALGAVLGWYFGKSVKLLFGITPARRLQAIITQKAHVWWASNRAETERFLEFDYDFIIDPILFPGDLFFLFNRVSAIANNKVAHPEVNVLELVSRDVEHYMILYTVLLAVLYIWWLGKIWRQRQQRREQRATARMLQAIAKKLDIPDSEYKNTDDGDKDKPVHQMEAKK